MPRLPLFLALIASPMLTAGPALSDSRLSREERAALGAEIRALLLAEPQIVQRAMDTNKNGFAPPEGFDPYADDKQADLGLIADNRPALTDPARTAFGAADAPLTIAIITGRNCSDCATMLQDLEKLAETNPIRVTQFDIQKDAALAKAIGATSAPYTVFPDMFLNGQIPAPILQRYIDKALAQ